MNIDVLTGSDPLVAHANPCITPPIPPEPPVTTTLTACIPVDLLTGQIEPDEDTTKWDGTGGLINLIDYPNISSALFEASFERDDGVGVHTFNVVNSVGTELASLDFSDPPPGEFNYRDTLRASMTIPVGDTSIFLQHEGQPTPGCHINHARVYFCVEDAERIRIQIPMVHGDADSGGFAGSEALNNVNFASIDVTTQSTYGQQSVTNYGIFLKERNKWGDISTWILRGIAYNKTYNPGDTGKVGLFNRTTGLLVTDAEITWDDTTDTPSLGTFEINIADDAINFTDGDEFEIQALNSSGLAGRRLKINRVDLLVLLVGETIPCQIYLKLDSQEAAGEPGIYRTRLEDYPTNSVILFEAVGRKPAVGQAFVRLYDCGTSDTDIVGTQIAELEFTELTKERLRIDVTALLIPGNRYIVKVVNIFFTSAFFIVEVPGA